MKKYSQHLMQLAVGVTILLGVLLILHTNAKSFKKIAADDIENISKLSSSIIYSEIDSNLTQPIFVSLTMANDRFLKNWLAEEPAEGGNDTQTALMQQYLLDYSQKYNYTSVFLVSAKSDVYYYQEGVNKRVSLSDAHDVWYYDFIKTGKMYDLDVDMDEVNDDQLTVFVNCRINDNHGQLLGVVGVGIRMSNLQALLRQYEEDYQLRAFLINQDGLVQVDSLVTNIETANFFSTTETAAKQTQIINNRDSMEIFWYPEGGTDHCLITQYIPNLDWYIVIEKNTADLQQALNQQINGDLLVISVIIALVLFMISYVLGKYNHMLLQTARMDDVTNLPNSKMFQEMFEHHNKRSTPHRGTLFLFDIDHFKNINDRFGHLFGNTALYRISEMAKKTIGDNGIVARWGGDEFVGVIYGPPENAAILLNELVENINHIREGELEQVTISLGATRLTGTGNLAQFIHEADVAMYRSKDAGRNRATFF